jgi:hypothetical protein
VNVASSVRVHEAWRAHHVATVGQIDDEESSPAGAYAVWAVIMHVAIVGACEVSAKSKLFHPSKKIWMIGECIFKWAMPLAGLPHEYAPALFQYVRRNDSRMVPKILDITLTAEHCFDCFMVAVGA